MNHLDVLTIAASMSSLQGLSCRCLGIETEQGRGTLAPDDLLDGVWQTLKNVGDIGLNEGGGRWADFDCRGQALSARGYIKKDPDVTTIKSHLTMLANVIMRDVGKFGFLWVHEDRKRYIDADAAFDTSDVKVSVAFHSAKRDVVEAGNCLGSDCNTAAVFHLMRAAEFAMRALGKDRDVEFKDKPIDQKEWGQILPALESKLTELREKTSASTWTDSVVREKQIAFYHEVIQELRSFNEAWRRHVSHADVLAFYDPDDALNIWTHVKRFLQKLATRISEQQVTPKIWTS